MTSRAKLHFDSGGTLRQGVCGILGRVTQTSTAVTCVLCLSRIPAPTWEPPPATKARYGRRGLSRDDVRVIERSKGGDDSDRREGWATAEAAICALAEAHDAGAALSSSGSAEERFRFHGGSAPKSGPTAAMMQLASVARVRVVLEACCALTAPGALGWLPLEIVVSIVVTRVAGLPARRGRRGAVVLREPCTLERVAEVATERTGIHVSREVAGTIVRLVMRGVDSRLREAGLIYGKPRAVRQAADGEWAPRRKHGDEQA